MEHIATAANVTGLGTALLLKAAAMFVQEEKIFAGKVLKIHVCTMDGTEWLEEVTEDTTVEKLKERCLKHYVHGSVEDPKTLTHHKLIHAATERVLTDTKTVADENLKDKDVLLLIKKRPPPTLPKMVDVGSEEKKKQENKAPDKDAILKATANLTTRHTDRTVTQHNIRDFQTELRKILVSLIEVAQKLLALNPDAVELFKRPMQCWMKTKTTGWMKLLFSSSQRWDFLRAELLRL